MAPNAKQCQAEGVRRVAPGTEAPAQAWLEYEDSRTNSSGENRRLLSPSNSSPLLPPPPRPKALQADLTLGLYTPVHGKYPLVHKSTKKIQDTKFQKRKQKVIDVLKPPYFILTMILVIICFHVWGTDEARELLEWAPGAWRREPWRLLTYGCVHAGATHLALNAIVALAVGWRLEREQGWWRVVVVWCLGVAAGALGAGALQPGVRVVGASAAVYALLTAHLPNVCLRFGHIPLWWFRPLSVLVLGLSEVSWALLHAPTQTAAALAHGAVTQSSPSHVAWAAHAMGAAIGLPIGFLIFTGERSSRPYVIVCRVASAVVLLVGVLLATLHYTCWSDIDYSK